jgi:CRP-like cAMP-binding protein
VNAIGNDKTLLSASFEKSGSSKAVPTSLAASDACNRLEFESQRVARVAGGSPFLSSRRFVERELIGRGGMGTVIRAFDRELERDVAIKVLTPDSTLSEADVRRLMEEARIAGRLEHPHIVPVYEFGVDDRGAHFLCMKLVQGETLEDTLSWAGLSRLEPELLAHLLQVFVKVCDAVAFAHSRGVLHRDLKPSNVMISNFGQVHVLDWGVARLKYSTRAPEELDDSARLSEQQGLIMGTPHYMAPEQLRGLHHQVDERTDVFALGATLYQILTGEAPHSPDLIPQIALHGARVTILAPEDVVEGATVPAELSRIALKAMAHDPANRYPSVDDLRRDVELFRRGTWHLPRKRFSAGSIIAEKGERDRSMCVVLEGTCEALGRVHERDVVLCELGAGDVIGETAFISDEPRATSIRALTDVVVMVITGETLSSALGVNCWMGNFVNAFADRFRELEERVRELDRRTRSTRPPRAPK